MPVIDGTMDTGFELRDISAPSYPVAMTLAATATGIITATFNALPYGVFWEIEIVSVSCNSTTPTRAFVYTDTPIADMFMVSSTFNGNRDQDDRNKSIFVEPTKKLTVQWTGASLGSVGWARVQVKTKALYPARRGNY